MFTNMEDLKHCNTRLCTTCKNITIGKLTSEIDGWRHGRFHVDRILTFGLGWSGGHPWGMHHLRIHDLPNSARNYDLCNMIPSATTLWRGSRKFAGLYYNDSHASPQNFELQPPGKSFLDPPIVLTPLRNDCHPRWFDRKEIDGFNIWIFEKYRQGRESYLEAHNFLSNDSYHEGRPFRYQLPLYTDAGKGGYNPKWRLVTT